jgi:ferredoxin
VSEVVDGAAILDEGGLQSLLDSLLERGYDVLGPRLRAGTIVLGQIRSVADLPRGVGDEQQPGRYRTTEREDDELFGFAAPAQSAKPLLFPAQEVLWRGRRDDGGFRVERPDPQEQPVAIVGLRGCDLAAVRIHDSVLMGRPLADLQYSTRRAQAFTVAVTCSTPAGTCFCTSMGTGPKPGPGADLTLTELRDPHRFLVEVGSPAGAQVLEGLPSRPAGAQDHDAAEALVSAAAAAMGRSMRTDDLPGLLPACAESPHWHEVASRCLACGNCTAACPTCFCTTVEDAVDLAGEVDERQRLWDSCFSFEYSRLHGGAVRTSTAARYRQWLTHKLASWVAQFGTSGCVGCGRCITWCPVGIDITAEVATLRDLATSATTRPAAGQGGATPAGGQS